MVSQLITDNLFAIFLFLAVVLVITARILGWNFVKGLMAGSWYMTQGRVEFGNVEERRVRYFNYTSLVSTIPTLSTKNTTPVFPNDCFSVRALRTASSPP